MCSRGLFWLLVIAIHYDKAVYCRWWLCNCASAAIDVWLLVVNYGKAVYCSGGATVAITCWLQNLCNKSWTVAIQSYSLQLLLWVFWVALVHFSYITGTDECMYILSKWLL